MAKNQKTYLDDESLLKIIETCTGDAQAVTKAASINVNTLRRRVYDLSLERGQLIKLTNLDEIKKRAEIKKNGLNINRKWLRASGFVEGQEFDLGQRGKKEIVLKLVK